MLLPRKWALSLGLLAAVPGISMAGPLDFLKPGEPQQQASAAQEDKNENQRVAEEIAKALSKQNLTHQNVSIEFKSGVATIGGEIKDEAQRALVSRVVGRVKGVETVQNNLGLMDESRPAENSAIQQAAGQQQPGVMNRQVQPVNFEQTKARSNQEVAQNIAKSLTAAGLSGYDIEVRYKNGVASLVGSVENQAQALAAHQATARVPGVGQVLNELKYSGPAAPEMQQQAYPQIQQAQGFAPPAPQGYAPQQMMPVNAPVQAYPGPAAQAGHQIYNQPNVPSHAWPSYAQYDNYSQVSYPSQYDASAWPYIGPYYPYPQVPMGWRSSTLEWDDGSWNLTFDSRTDRWWWFLNPKNW